MKRCRPLALSPQQLNIVMAGAAQLCVTCRDGYLQRIADQLGGLDNFSDSDVQQAVITARATLEENAA